MSNQTNGRIAYVVTSGEYSDYGIEGVFSTREQAEAFIGRMGRLGPDAQVEEYPLDGRQEDAARPVWTVRLAGDGDELSRSNQEEVCPPRFTETDIQPVSWGSGFVYVGKSAVSEDHALKLVVECRQKHMRESGLNPATAP